MKHRKGMALNEMSGVVLAFVVVAIIVGIGGTTLTSIQQTQCVGGSAGYTSAGCGTGGSAYNTSTIASNATTKALTGIITFGDWLPTIAVISAAAVVIGLIYMYFR